MGQTGTIAIASAVLLLAGAQQAEAKTPTLREALQICAPGQDPSERLACLEGLAKSSAADAPSQTTASTDETPSKAPVAAPEPRAVPKAPVTASEQQAARKEARRRVEEGSDRTRGTYDAVVLRAWEYATGDYYIALTNGEVWKSQAPDKVRPVKDHEEVELRPGAVGGWFMAFKTLKRPTIRVSLVQ